MIRFWANGDQESSVLAAHHLDCMESRLHFLRLRHYLTQNASIWGVAHSIVSLKCERIFVLHPLAHVRCIGEISMVFKSLGLNTVSHKMVCLLALAHFLSACARVNPTVWFCVVLGFWPALVVPLHSYHTGLPIPRGGSI